MVLPQIVIDIIRREGIEGKIHRQDSAKLQFRDLICVPGHDHDLQESNVTVHTINLTKVGEVSLIDTCSFYVKTDPQRPAYIVASWHMDEHEYWWAEF